jgi:hypothetical protein
LSLWGRPLEFIIEHTYTASKAKNTGERLFIACRVLGQQPRLFSCVFGISASYLFDLILNGYSMVTGITVPLVSSLLL